MQYTRGKLGCFLSIWYIIYLKYVSELTVKISKVHALSMDKSI